MRSILSVAAILWLSTAVAGGLYLKRYEATAGGERRSYPAAFPPESGLTAHGDHPTLIFFAHPKCPCTRSSLHELERLMAETDGKLTAYVVFIKPTDAPAGWTDTDLRATAEGIPGVHTVMDDAERESHIFNAEISGTVLLYGRDGDLKFSGGITSARAHEGDNAGRQAIVEIVNLDAANAETPVFGCPLHKADCPGDLLQPAQ